MYITGNMYRSQKSMGIIACQIVKVNKEKSNNDND